MGSPLRRLPELDSQGWSVHVAVIGTFEKVLDVEQRILAIAIGVQVDLLAFEGVHEALR
jgi:hypothetical protein